MEDYKTAVKSHQNVIDTKKAEIKKLTDSLTDLSEERKQLRREVAKMMMDKDTHMEMSNVKKLMENVTTKVKVNFSLLLRLLSPPPKPKKIKKVYGRGAIELAKRRQRRLKTKRRL